ncbi:MAG: hypothetical protein ACKO2F_08190 [Cyanobacteriota bacterium]
MSAEANRIVLRDDGGALESQYRQILEHLGKQHGLLDKEQWMILSADIKSDRLVSVDPGAFP